MSRVGFYLLILALLVTGLGLTLYRHVEFEVPWTPGEERQVWHVEALVRFEAKGEPVKASLALPTALDGFRLLSEHTASPGYGLHFIDEESGRRAQWTIRSASGSQQLYYSAQFLVSPDEGQAPQTVPHPPEAVEIGRAHV